VGTVEDSGNLAGMTQAAARTLALVIALFRIQFEGDTHV
jgi:hypothetical protein